MAKLHMTPDGPKACSAQSEESCHFTHYSTPEAAIAAWQMEKAKHDAKTSKAALENHLRNLSDDDAVQPVQDMQRRGDLGPSLRDRIREIEERTGRRPEFVPGITSGTFRGPGGDYYMLARKGYTVEGSPPRVVPNWTLTTAQIVNGARTDEQTHTYPLTNAAEGRELKKGALASINRVTQNAWPGDPSEAEEQKSRAVDSFVNTVNSCETAERGVMAADEVGFSNFRGSDASTVRVQADWSESFVEPGHMEDALKSQQYKRTNPEVHMLIQDSKCKTSSNYWTAERDEQGWRVHLTRGENTEVRVTNSQESLRDTIYSFSKDEMGSSEERATRSSQDTMELFGRTEYEIREHEERVEAEQERERLEREKELHSELYEDQNQGKQKRGLGKLLGIFG